MRSVNNSIRSLYYISIRSVNNSMRSLNITMRSLSKSHVKHVPPPIGSLVPRPHPYGRSLVTIERFLSCAESGSLDFG